MSYPWKKLADFGTKHLLDGGDCAQSSQGHDQWFVDADADVTGDGRSWDHPFITIQEALAKAGDFDIIYLGEATMKATTGETFPLQITQEGLRIYGVNPSMNQNKSLIYNSASAVVVFEILANNVEIRNVSITQGAAADAIQLGSATVAAVYKFYMSDVRVDCYGTGVMGVASHTATVDAPDLHIENCLFRGMTGHAIEANWTRAMINDCVIYTVAANAGIEHVPTTTSRPASVYARNRIIGVDSTDTGILISNTPGAGLLSAYDNYILNCATSITQKAENTCVQFNYESDGAGGAIIDPIA